MFCLALVQGQNCTDFQKEMTTDQLRSTINYQIRVHFLYTSGLTAPHLRLKFTVAQTIGTDSALDLAMHQEKYSNHSETKFDYALIFCSLLDFCD